VIQLLEDPASAAEWCAARRAEGRSLGFVPTMGALHEGHLGLVRRAVEENDRACVSVFVNPLQFDEAADFERYPRDLGRDAELLDSTGCHMVFTGTLEQFFPASGGDLRRVPRRDPGPTAVSLEGEWRPGHFDGVATIVARLFEVVRPDRAYFGLKDFQQSLVVADVARSLGYPEVVPCPTAREPSGLARSSRNELLTHEQRAEAAAIHRALSAARAGWSAGERSPGELAERMRAVLEATSLKVEYAELRDPERWTPEQPERPLERAVALIAARAGPVRLIDNLRLDGDPA
jgi:pantoate--beta-alanine ligase